MQQEQLILRERPNGLPDDNTLEYKNIDVPESGQGEILVKTRSHEPRP